MGRQRRELLAFGGPLNEQVYAIAGRDPIQIAVPTEPYWWPPADPAVLIDEKRVTYTVEKLAFHDERACPGRPMCGEACHWWGEVLVADGYPKQRITDQMNALLALCSWSWPFGPIAPSVRPIPPQEEP